MRQLLTESLVLSAAGGITGVAFAIGGLHVLVSLAPAAMPDLRQAHINANVLAFSLALSTLTGLLFGLAPAWIAGRTSVNEMLKRNSSGSTRASVRRGLSSALVIFEVTAALVLLGGAGLLTRSFIELTRVGPGFEIGNTTALSLSLPEKRYHTPEQRLAFVDALLSKVRALPEVSDVGLTNALPLMGGPIAGFYVEGRKPAILSEGPITTLYAVTPDYFRAMGVRLLRGRAFSVQDNARAPRVVIINQTLARQQFPAEDPIGKRVWLATGGEMSEVIGVVADIAQPGFERLTMAQAYGSFAQYAQWPYFSSSFSLVVRTEGRPASMASWLRPTVYSIDKDQPVGSVRPFDELFADLVSRQRFATTLLGVFSVIALLIATVGIYGVTAYHVTQRTAEIGIRISLGASRQDVLKLVGGQAGRLIGLGLLLGLAGTIAAAHAVRSMLYHIGPHDPITLAVVTLIFASAGSIACLVPARRAMRVDPIVALRDQ
jgi:putative ABC transport system permease protein